ncbi:MAG: ribbon-helix-helix protein, CopG family [Desulfobacterales bacterium]|nr:ribbon-helix-helix protein, CopG family [Desulfobacterales bacterium]
MKAIQITISPQLLERIDNDEETKKKGRSAFLRHAVQYYLQQKKLKSISRQYSTGYARGVAKDSDFAAWEDEQVWPEI